MEKKKAKAKQLGIDLTKIEGELTEARLDELIDQKSAQIAQDAEEKRIAKEQAAIAAAAAKDTKVILKDVDGQDVDQADYFFPRLEDEKLPDGKVLKKTTETAPEYFNKMCGMPVDDPDLINEFVKHFPRSKGFLFYKQRRQELYLVIVPLKYATTVNRSNESRPGDFQRHALSFINEGSVNLDSLKLKLARISKHSSISREAIA